MILYEFEGKKLLQDAGINIPNGQIVSSDSDSGNTRMTIQPPCVLKAQVLSGKRAQAGGIIILDKGDDVKGSLEGLFKKTINGEKVDQILVEEKLDYGSQEYYLSISYDTDTRGPVLTMSVQGGTGVEQRKAEVFPIDPLKTSYNTIVANDVIKPVVDRLVRLFFDQDCLLLEINPLVKVGDQWIALDAKVKLDESAAPKHEDWNFPPRSAPGHTPTENEIAAKKIDEGDYRGVAGSTYFDLPGDIAVLSSGGGVSLTAMDALIKEGGQPANFTEYSGNPPKEKVLKLTKIVLNKPNIHGLWVIGTVAANFTDIYETLSGFMEALKELKSEGIKLDYPIVIRRGGPRDKEAFEMLREIKDFNLILQSEEVSIAESAKTMAEEAKKYANN